MRFLLFVLGLVVATSLPAHARSRPGHLELGLDGSPTTQRMLDGALEKRKAEPTVNTTRTTALVLGGVGVGTALAGGLLLASDGDHGALGGTLVGVGAVSTLVGGFLYYKSSAQARAQAQRREDQPAPLESVAGVDKKRIPDRIPKKLPIMSVKF